MSEYIKPPESLPAGAVVWAYLRDSGGDSQEQSVNQQREAIEAYCQEYGLVLGRVFADDARSGGKVAGREDFEDLIDKSGDADMRPAGLLLWNFARFARNLDDSGFYKALLRKRGLVVHSLTDPIPAGEWGRVIETILDISNEEKLKQISRDVKRALAALVRQGFSSGGKPPKGYKPESVVIGHKRDGQERLVSRWIPDPDLWEVCQLAWKLRAEGASYGEIQKATGGRVFRSKNSWPTFFTNKTYLGVGKCGGLEIENHHPAMITAEVFEAVQNMRLGSPRYKQVGHIHHPMRVAHPSLLSGLAVCMFCGSAMSCRRSSDWPCYTCGKKERQGSKSCENRQINARRIDQEILAVVFERILTPDYLLELLEAVKAQQSDPGQAQGEVNKIRAEQRENERKIKNLVEMGEVYGAGAVKDQMPMRLAERGRLAEELRRAEAKLEVSRLDISPEAWGLVVQTWRGQLLEAKEADDIRKLQGQLRRFVARVELGYTSTMTARIWYTYPIRAEYPTSELTPGGGIVCLLGIRPVEITWR